MAVAAAEHQASGSNSWGSRHDTSQAPWYFFLSFILFIFYYANEISSYAHHHHHLDMSQHGRAPVATSPKKQCKQWFLPLFRALRHVLCPR